MKNSFFLSIAALVAGLTCLRGQDVLITCWEFSNLPGDFAGNVLFANVSDQRVPDGASADGPTGTMYADGQFGSSNIDNSFAFTFIWDATSSNFNNDVLTSTRPLADDLSDLKIDIAPGRLSINDGSFGGGGNADPSGKYVVFAAHALDGNSFQGPVVFSSAIGVQVSNGVSSKTVEFSYSYDGVNYTLLPSFTATQIDANGPEFTFNDAAGKSAIYLRMTVPSLPLGDALYLDNLQFVGALGDGPVSFWADSPLQAGGWRYSGEGYADEPGIGWIHDATWPYIYTYGQGDPNDGDWVFILTAGGSRNGFFGYNYDLSYWFYGISQWGWYFRYAGNSGEWLTYNL